MAKLWMFGDSFLAPWTRGFQEFGNQDRYIAREKKEGNDYIGDLEYWLKKTFDDKKVYLVVKNHAKGGYSNESILNSVDRNFDMINRADIVILSSTLTSRITTVNLDMEKIINVNFPHIDNTDSESYKGYQKYISENCFFDLDYLEKKGVEQMTRPFLVNLIEKYKLYIKAIRLKGAYPIFLTIYADLKPHTDIPSLFFSNEGTFEPIFSKYPEINDAHPTYESNKKIAEKIVEFVMKDYIPILT